MEDVYAILGIAAILFVVAGFTGLVVWRWRSGALARPPVAQSRYSGVDDTEYRSRLGTVNNLLSRVQAADSERQSLESDLAGRIRAYLGNGITPRAIPARTSAVINDLVQAERLLSEVQLACHEFAALPAVMAAEVDRYLGTRPRLES